MAYAARTEASLLSLLDNDDPDEGAVRSAVATLSESSAYWPTELLARGDAWVAQKDAEAGEREAEAARLAQIREQEEKEREEQARRDREASELAEREAAERQAEADRLAAEPEAAAEAERAQREAEEARPAALEESKPPNTDRVYVGNNQDENK